MATEIEAEGYRSAPWLSPPRLRTVLDESDRHATWLELFFDLVFVAAVAQVAGGLVDDHSAEGFLRFAGLFFPVIWAWAGFTFYANRFDTDDLVYRLTVAAGMLATAALAISIKKATIGGSTAFVLSYLGTRVVLLALYARAYKHVVEARDAIRVYLEFFTVGALIWAASLAVDTPARYWFWVVAMTIEIATPLLGWRRLRRTGPVQREHIEERFGLFTIIVLGEAVIAVVTGTDLTGWQVESGMVAACGFIAALCLWWIYFDLADTSIIRRGLVGLVYVYGHIPLYMGVAAAGVGVKLAIKEAPSGHLSAGTRWALCGGIAVFLLSLVLFFLATRSRQRAGVATTRVAAATLLIAAAAFGSSFEPVVMLVAIVAMLVAETIFEARVCRGHPLVCAPYELYAIEYNEELPVVELPVPAEPGR